jgi:transcription elongation GreA/GreB family factor
MTFKAVAFKPMALKTVAFKTATLKSFYEYFLREKDALVASAQAAHSAATHEQSRAEDRHDTFAIEASYLAAGQAKRVQELDQAAQECQRYLKDQRQADRIEAGALVGLTLNTQAKSIVLWVNQGAGNQLTVDGKVVSLLSLNSPLGEQAQGLKAGDSFTLETPSGDREYHVDWIG